MSIFGAVPDSGRVVVGVDGSLAARRAVRFAAAEAGMRGLPLRILTVVDRPPAADTISPQSVLGTGWDGEGSGARALLDEALELAEETFPGLAVETAVRFGSTCPALVRESTRADLLVLGTRGRGTTIGLLLGSVAIDVIARAHCPVAVVPPDPPELTDRHGAVAVGVAGGPHFERPCRRPSRPRPTA